MLNKLNKSFGVFLTCVTLLATAGCSAASTTRTAATISRQVPVQRGDLVVSVSVDGNLVMPQAFTLNFGAPGDVKDVFVTEGDRVREGAIMATLDDTSQRLDIKSANNAVQTTLSDLYETVPRLPQFPGVTYSGARDARGNIIYTPREGWDAHPIPVYQMYYPGATALISCNWAQGEVTQARDLIQAKDFTSASSELYIALSDLESCIKILEDTINNPESGLGNTAPYLDDSNYVLFSIQNDNSFAAYYIQELRDLVSRISQGRADITKIRELIYQGKYDDAVLLIDSVCNTTDDISKKVIININTLKLRNDTTIYGKDISLYFYGAAEETLNLALKGIQSGGLQAPELKDNLRIAKHQIELCNGILGTNFYVLQHGMLLQTEQKYKVNLEMSMVDMGNKKDAFLKTVILAPFDGMVVNVSVKKNDVLSQQDYSSKGTIQLVDTSQIKFQGTVDEIDIMKIKTGQKATVSVDAIPNKTFTGKVSFISPFGAADTSNVIKFNVTILLEPTDVDLKGGLTATADIGISTVENALIVPLSAVTTTGTSSTVTVAAGDKGKTEKRQVMLGIQNQQYVQILKGLTESDQVIIIDKASGAPVSTTMGHPGGGPPGGGPPPGR
jgi:multidrug efflux pump subunit AcrA (membrane-fusion protein)